MICGDTKGTLGDDQWSAKNGLFRRSWGEERWKVWVKGKTWLKTQNRGLPEGCGFSFDGDFFLPGRKNLSSKRKDRGMGLVHFSLW